MGRRFGAYWVGQLYTDSPILASSKRLILSVCGY
jgi:hypothetical protein